MGLHIRSFAITILLSSVLSTLADQSRQCQRECGDQTVPYPFGISGDFEECFRNSSYKLLCIHTDYNPPMLFWGNIPIFNISVETATATVQIYTAYRCYNESGVTDEFSQYINLNNSPFSFSSTLNTFMAIGCDTVAYLSSKDDQLRTGCFSICDTSIPDQTQITQVGEPCSNIGCCHTKIPKGFKHLEFHLSSFSNHSNIYGSNPCDFAFLTGPNAKLVPSAENAVSSEVVLDWAVGNSICEEPKSICGPNTNCVNSNNSSGYRCSCRQGYTGNPFTVEGCQGNGDTKAAVSSATADTVQVSYVGYMVLLLLSFIILQCIVLLLGIESVQYVRKCIMALLTMSPST